MTQQQSQHSIVLPPEREFESSIYRSPHAKDGLLELYWPEVTTLYSGLERSVKLYGESPALGWREKIATGEQGFGGGGPYLWLTYNEVAHLTRSIGSALSQLLVQNLGHTLGSFRSIRKNGHWLNMVVIISRWSLFLFVTLLELRLPNTSSTKP